MLRSKQPAVAVEVNTVNASTLRLLWTVVDETQTSTLVQVADAELVQQLLWQLKNKIWLTSEETKTISAYLSSRVPLIRDLALARLA
ncbi:MAG: hypothetical protein IGS49_03295 [Chlorogloeopsis fritschii C42_A2020_084]|jgi:muconolactone delta-isomerase|uniref:hypothetical protein n=1 Tax=Chlorogloeopsis fritschii TaxID=1124 RepID=UPI0019D8BE7E|nr:hypothetical protein [Chlorogloeopsis fritschii]MBF2004506.1 hypothetical protein [Chlorogloeopsis fritschii C42_A2020_084]